jgi:hypothetical protein
MNQSADIQTLAAAIKAGTVPADKLSFARDLVAKGGKWNLSEKQLYWVRKLSQPKKSAEAIGNLQKLNELFARAQDHLKRPSVTLVIDGKHVRVKKATEASKYFGQIQVVSTGGFGGPYYGRVTQDGTFVPGRDELPSLVETLRRLAAEPAKVAAEHGKLTGMCCFCGRGLDDDRSTAVGYGPVCAKHYGLPWGDDSTVEQLTDLEAEQEGWTPVTRLAHGLADEMRAAFEQDQRETARDYADDVMEAVWAHEQAY